jgi:hypothetical protein
LLGGALTTSGGSLGVAVAVLSGGVGCHALHVCGATGD